MTCAPTLGQESQVVTSLAPDRIALTVYRGSSGSERQIVTSYVQGFAMITETRIVRLPRGRTKLRFEGVAEGIVPVSAVITGLPGGTVEKNRDARLLSPAALVDGTLGRQVTVTRTDKATGRQVSEDATVVAGPANGVVLRTQTGVEALRCAGLPEKLSYSGVPAGLSSKPVLSVVTDSPSVSRVRVQLTYLASGFDWRASYVAKQAQDGRSLDLFAWLTLANGNAQGFANAEVSVVAGRLNRIYTPAMATKIATLRLVCYPLGSTTSDLRGPVEKGDIIVTARRRVEFAPSMAAPPPPPPPPPPAPSPEDLGDLKLYRVPQRVTVNAAGLKQVALLARNGVRFEQRYRLKVNPDQWLNAAPTSAVLVLTNTPVAGLGLALPAGSTALYAARGDGSMQLLGLGAMKDRAVGEVFRLAAGRSTQVRVSHHRVTTGEGRLRVTNANPFPVIFEIPIDSPGRTIKADGAPLPLIEGLPTWTQTVSSGDTIELRYSFK